MLWNRLFAVVVVAVVVGGMRSAVCAAEEVPFTSWPGFWFTAAEPVVVTEEETGPQDAAAGETLPELLKNCVRAVALVRTDKLKDAAALLDKISEKAKPLVEGESPTTAQQDLRGAILHARGFLQLRQGQQKDFITTAAELVKLLGTCEDAGARPRELDATAALVRALVNAGRFEECASWTGRITQLVESSGLSGHYQMADRLAALGMSAKKAGLKANGNVLTTTALKWAEFTVLGEPASKVKGLLGLAAVHGLLENRTEVIVTLEKARDLAAAEAGVPADLRAEVLTKLGRACVDEFEHRRSITDRMPFTHLDTAEKAFNEALELARKADPGSPQQVALCMSDVARLLEQRNKRVEALKMRAEAFALADKPALTYDPKTVEVLHGYVGALLQLERTAKAEELGGELLNRAKVAFGDYHTWVAEAHLLLSRIYLARQDLKAAETSVERVAGVLERALGTMHRRTAGSYRDLSRVRMERQDVNGGEAYAKHALDIDLKAGGVTSLDVLEDLTLWVPAMLSLGRADEALATVNKVVDQIEDEAGDQHEAMTAMILLLPIQSARGKGDAAEQAVNTVLAIMETKKEPIYQCAKANLQLGHAGFLHSQKKHLKALPLLRQSILGLVEAAKDGIDCDKELYEGVVLYSKIQYELGKLPAVIADQVKLLRQGINPIPPEEPAPIEKPKTEDKKGGSSKEKR